MTTQPSPARYTLRIDLLDSEPAIWRRLRVNDSLSLDHLHRVLTTVMGWSGQADYRFKGLHQVFEGGLDLPPSEESTDEPRGLEDFLSQPGDTLLYTYDLTEGWLHRIVLEASEAATADGMSPHCTEGERACPPEFCQGIWGYEDLLDRLSDPDNPEADALWERVGYDFDPEYFDRSGVNQRLQALEI
ncbi:MAG: plasmid pRiA4b ORF-3 family protein [Nodosilinea sp.]